MLPHNRTSLLSKYSKSLSALPLHHVSNSPNTANASSHPNLSSPKVDQTTDSLSESGISLSSSLGASVPGARGSLNENNKSSGSLSIPGGDSGSLNSSNKSPSGKSTSSTKLQENKVGIQINSSSSSSHGGGSVAGELKEKVNYRDSQSVRQHVLEIDVPTQILKSILLPPHFFMNYSSVNTLVAPSSTQLNTFYKILKEYPQLTYKYTLEVAKKCCNAFDNSNFETEQIYNSLVNDSTESISNRSQDLQHTRTDMPTSTSVSDLYSKRPRVDLLMRIFRYFLNIDVFAVVEPDIYFLMELDQFIHSGISDLHIQLKKTLSKLNTQIRICVEGKHTRDRDVWKSYLNAMGVEEEIESWRDRVVTMKDVNGRSNTRNVDLQFRASQFTHGSFQRSPHIEKRRDFIQDFTVYRLNGRSTNFGEVDRSVNSSVRAFVTRKRSLLDSLDFGAQFRQIAKFEDKMPEIDLSDIIVIENVTTIYRHIARVAEAKKSEDSDDESDLSSNEEIGLLSDNRDLNQSRIFEKIALEESITLDNAEHILNTLVDPDADLQDYMEATHQLLHLLGDLFWTNDIHEIFQSQYFFLEMIQSPAEKIRGHTFDLLYNLYLHLKSNSSPNAFSRYHPILCEFHRNLTLHILLDNENSDEVWKSSHACFLSLVDSTYSEVMKYDARVMKKYIGHFSSNDENQFRKFILILVNMLYFSKTTSFSDLSDDIVIDNSNPEINFYILDQIGGIRYILDIYSQSQSFEVRNNLFVVIYDYVIHLVNSSSKRSCKRDHVQSLFQILVKADAPQYLYQLFKFKPPQFAARFAKFVYTNLILVQCQQFENFPESEHAIDYKRLGLSRTFMSVIIRFSGHLHRLSSHYLGLDNEFLPMYEQIMDLCSEEDIFRYFDQLKTLLGSNDVYERRNGKRLTSMILIKLDELKDKPDCKQLHLQTEYFFLSLCNDQRKVIKSEYLNIFEELIYYYRSLYQVHGDEKYHKILMRHINEGLLKFTSIKTHSVHLLMQAFYILMNFLSIYYTPPGNLRQPLQSEIPLHPGSQDDPTDTISSMFLGGQIAIPNYLLKDISIGVLRSLFDRITESLVMESMSSSLESCVERARCVLFVLMIQKCNRKSSVLDSLGGIAFFKYEMMNDNNPGVAYFASEFLIRVLVREAKKEYYDFLKQIIQIAHNTNDAYLLDNPYLQLYTLMTEKGGKSL